MDNSPKAETADLIVSSKVVSRSVGEAVILLDLNSGTYYSLDGAGAVLWAGIEAGRPFDEMVCAVVEEYDVDAVRALADALKLIEDGLERGLLVRGGERETR